MTLIVEIRCDNRNEGNDECWSHETLDSYSAHGHTLAAGKDAILDAIKAYKDAGWLIKPNQAHCPSCIEFLSMKKNID